MNNNKTRSSKTAGLLALFLGTVGAHNFYLGEKKKAFGHLALTLLEIAAVIAWIIAEAKVSEDLSHLKLTAALTDANTVDTARNAFYAISGANATWAIVELVMIAKEGENGIIKRGFKSANPELVQGNANPATTPMQPGQPIQPAQPMQPIQPAQPSQPTQPETPNDQPPANPGMITG